MPDTAQIIVDSVSVKNLLGHNQTIDVSWHLSDTNQQVAGYILSILSNGKSIRNFINQTAATTDTLDIPNDLLSANTAYQLQIWYRDANGNTSPGSTPIPLIVEAPTITSAKWSKK